MAEIIIENPTNVAYSPIISTGAGVVTIRGARLPVEFISENNERLMVVEQDGGFVVRYRAGFGEVGFDSGDVQFKNGHVAPKR